MDALMTTPHFSTVERSTPHRLYPVRVFEDVGVLRRAVATHARWLPAMPVGDSELVATELATNILRHTDGGYVLVRLVAEGIELIAVDHGSGQGSGPSSWPGPGLGVGLATVRRRASTFDMYTGAKGTVVFARLAPAAPSSARDAGRWRWGAVDVPRGGSGDSGDAWAVAAGTRLTAVLVDGLGHGPEAAAAANAAIAAFTPPAQAEPSSTHLTDLTRQAHEAMRGTRGGVFGTCIIDPDRDELTFAGVGNITGRVLAGTRSSHLVGQHGTLGIHLAPPTPKQSTHPWAEGATVIMTTDGIDGRWDPAAYPRLLRHHPTVVAATIHRDHTRDRDDAAVLVLQDMHGRELREHPSVGGY
jgi:anti-sigma regulatory factor (Ser/Thr protein kinase)